MTLRNPTREKPKAHLVGGWWMRVCGLVNKGGTAFRCKSQITKTPELRFRVVLGNGRREVRFERVVPSTH